MQTAIAYTRVSSIDQVKDGNSLATQKRIISDWAKRNDVKVLEWFVEEGESAKTADRTKLKEMLKYTVQHHEEIDLLLVYKVDRLSRQTSDYLAIKEALSKRGIRVYSVSEQFDDTPMGKAMEGISSIFAQLDNDNRAERCKNGMMDGVDAGRWMWPAPIGYINGRDVTGKRNIVLDNRDGFVDILQSAWKLIAVGYNETDTLKIINTKLEDKGYKKIPKQTFSRMFRNEVYVGVINAFGKRVQSSTIEPLVDADLFYKVLSILNKDKNKGNRYNKYNPKYPLRGILFCKNGHKMTASSPKGRNKHYPKYHCMKCSGKHMNYDVDKVNNQFLEYISNIQMDSNMEEALKEAIKLNLGETAKEQEKKIKTYQKRLIAIDNEREQIVKKNLASVIPDRTAQFMLGNLENEETSIRLELSEIRRPDDNIMDLLEFGMSKLRNLSETIKQITDPKIRFRFQKWLFPAGLMYDGEKFGTAILPSILQIKRTAFVGVSNEKVSFGEPGGTRTHDTKLKRLVL